MDTIPLNYLTLAQAFELLFQQMHGVKYADEPPGWKEHGPLPVGLTNDKVFAEDEKRGPEDREVKRGETDTGLLEGLQSGALTAFVQQLGKSTLEKVDTHLWNYDSFAAVQFYSGPIIAENPNDEWHDQHGRTLIVNADHFTDWLEKLKSSNLNQNIAAETKTETWLIKEMRTSLSARPKPKKGYHNEAKDLFKVNGRGFERAWNKAIKVTGAIAWHKAGAPKKSVYQNNPCTKIDAPTIIMSSIHPHARVDE